MRRTEGMRKRRCARPSTIQAHGLSEKRERVCVCRKDLEIGCVDN